MTLSLGMPHLKDIIQTGAHFHESTHLTTHEQDGRQFFQVGWIAWERLTLLASQLARTFPNLMVHRNVVRIPLVLGGVLQLAYPSADRYLSKCEKNVLLDLICRTIKATASFMTTYTNDIIDAACAVSYVAMIAFGSIATGAIGLTGLLCLNVPKRLGKLPIKVDYILEPMTLVAKMISDFSLPFALFSRALQVNRYVDKWTHLIIKNSATRKYLPEWIKHPMPGTHHVEEKHNLRKSFKKFEEVQEKVKSNENFTLNHSHLFSKHFGYLSDELIKKSKNQSMERLVGAVEAKIVEKGVKIKNKSQDIEVKDSSGWKDFKDKVVNNRFKDQGVANIEAFNFLMKVLLTSLLEEKNDNLFEAHVLDLAKAGNNCTRGLTRDLKRTLQPGREDVKWATHYILAQLRGEILMKFLSKEDQFVRKWTKNVISTEIVGGTEDTHLRDYLQVRYWHRYRTYDGERNRELKGRNLFEAVLDNLYGHFEGWKKSLCEAVLFTKYALSLLDHPEMAGFAIGLFPYVKDFDKEYTVDTVVKEVHNAIKAGDSGTPYIYHKETDTLKEVAQIPSDVIQQKWMQDITNCQGFENMVAPDKISQWTTDSVLTEDGVRLLLWDLGILTPKIWF